MTDQEIQEAVDNVRCFMNSIRANVLESPTTGMPDPEALADVITQNWELAIERLQLQVAIQQLVLESFAEQLYPEWPNDVVIRDEWEVAIKQLKTIAAEATDD